MMLETSRRYRSLEELIQSQVSDLTGDVPGIVVVLPHLGRFDIYTSLNPKVRAAGEKPSREVLDSIPWVVAINLGNAEWICRDVTEDQKRQLATLLG